MFQNVMRFGFKQSTIVMPLISPPKTSVETASLPVFRSYSQSTIMHGEKKMPIVVTIESVPGKKITEVIGIVSDSTFSHGDIPISRLAENAQKLGADAVVGLRMNNTGSYNLYYGTAVTLADSTPQIDAWRGGGLG